MLIYLRCSKCLFELVGLTGSYGSEKARGHLYTARVCRQCHSRLPLNNGDFRHARESWRKHRGAERGDGTLPTHTDTRPRADSLQHHSKHV